jgi:hypothetical protein
MEALPGNIISTAALVVGGSNWNLIEWPARCIGIDLEQFRQQSLVAELPTS